MNPNKSCFDHAKCKHPQRASGQQKRAMNKWQAGQGTLFSAKQGERSVFRECSYAGNAFDAINKIASQIIKRIGVICA
jgi:hypothetical protein